MKIRLLRHSLTTEYTKPLTRPGPMPSNRWPPENELSGIWGDYFCSIMFSLAFFSPYFFLWFLILICVLRDFYVSQCVCLYIYMFFLCFFLGYGFSVLCFVLSGLFVFILFFLFFFLDACLFSMRGSKKRCRFGRVER